MGGHKLPFLVYQITNTVNGKRYVGYTGKTLKQRLAAHVNSARGEKSKTPLHRAIRKYGKDSFVSEALYTEESSAGAKETEILCILDIDPEYNRTMGGDGVSGLDVLPETRERLRVSALKNQTMSRPDVIERHKKSIPRGDDHYTRDKTRAHPRLGKRGALSPLTGRKRPRQSELMSGENHPRYGKSIPKSVSLSVSESNTRRAIRYWGA